jgi:hypothetical protein
VLQHGEMVMAPGMVSATVQLYASYSALRQLSTLCVSCTGAGFISCSCCLQCQYHSIYSCSYTVGPVSHMLVACPGPEDMTPNSLCSLHYIETLPHRLRAGTYTGYSGDLFAKCSHQY